MTTRRTAAKRPDAATDSWSCPTQKYIHATQGAIAVMITCRYACTRVRLLVCETEGDVRRHVHRWLSSAWPRR
jgi:hypothetical protein